MLHRIPFSLSLAYLICFSGCGPAKLKEERTWNLDANRVAEALDLPPQSRSQTVNVEFSATADVSAFIFNESDAVGDNGLTEAKPEKALGKIVNAKEGRFSATVPPNTATRVIVRFVGKKAEVNIKLSNSK